MLNNSPRISRVPWSDTVKEPLRDNSKLGIPNSDRRRVCPWRNILTPCYRAHVFRPLFTPKSLFWPFTISRPYPYSYTPITHSFLFLHFPFHTSQEQDETAHGLLLTIRYWYMRIDIAIVRRPLSTRMTQPALLTRTREPRHLRTPTTGLAMGQGLTLGADPHLPRGYIENTLRTIK